MDQDNQNGKTKTMPASSSSSTPMSAAGEGGRWGTWVMGVPTEPKAHPVNQRAATWVADDAMDPAKAGAGTTNYNNYYSGPPVSGGVPPSQSYTGNPYVQTSPVPNSSGKSPMDMIMSVLNKLGKKFDKTARQAEAYAGNVWQHLRTSPHPADTAMGRITQGTKALIEGGQDKVFHQTFQTLPGEQLRKTFACYLSTSSGPVVGTLYLSTARLAFCSDSPLCYSPCPGQQEWIHYKVIVLLEQLVAVTPSSNRLNPSEKYIQIVTRDGHEFWFMGFVSYDKALQNLTEAVRSSGAFLS
ncbi:GLABRA2 expression modulator [Nymphaea thermarum]|nr:GLABRA2 expression modulator [Nymphaea thermarum]